MRLEYNGSQMKAKAIADELEFVKTREVIYHGKTYWQWVAQADVTLTRPATPSQKKGKKPAIPGEPVCAKMVVSRVLSEEGEVLAQWLILTNMKQVEASTIALWYYWRWQIECFFKLLKSAGHHLESWQQESALAIAKRLLVVSMACVTVWQIAADKSQEAHELRLFLIKLSGRQMRQKVEFSNPALLAGLWVFLSMFEIMNSYTHEELNSFKTTAQQIFGKLV
jgi:IS4 transposase